MYTVITGSGPVLGWRPAPTGAPAYNPATARRLGQNATTTQPAVTPPSAAPARPAFIDSRPVQVATDLAALIPSAMLTYAFWKAKSTTWAVIFTGATMVFAGKLIYDVTQLEK